MIPPLIVLGEIMDLGMAIVTGSNTVGRPGRHDLVKFHLPVLMSGLSETGLQIPPATAATEIVGHIGAHINKVFFPDDGLYHKTEIFSNRITKGFPDQLAGVLNRKLDLEVLIPFRIYLELSLLDPLSVKLNDALNFKIMRDVEFFESGPDCKKLVASFRIKPDFTTEIINGLGLDPDDMFPGLPVLGEHTVVFCGPTLCAICPVRPYHVQNFPERDHFIRLGDRFP
jgi:hypothetical protein